jgi:hypothetical protein
MGLGFVGAEAHWSYFGFNNFRRKLALEIGVCLDLMEYFWVPGYSNSSFEICKNMVGMETVNKYFSWLPPSPMKWKNIKDPIVDLLNHSDCDGSLTPSQCRKIAPRIRELVADWSDEDYDKRQALLLADGMENCSKSRKRLKFC